MKYQYSKAYFNYISAHPWGMEEDEFEQKMKDDSEFAKKWNS